MKNGLKIVLAAVGMMAMVGCQGGGTKTADASGVRSDVTDIRPTESTSVAYQPAPITYEPAPAAVQPVSYQSASTATPAATAAGNTHIVRHGETLFSIAKSSYGDGKQWTRIASANPGVSPTTLKVGQTLVIP